MHAEAFRANGHPSLDALISLDTPLEPGDKPNPALVERAKRGRKPAIMPPATGSLAEPALADSIDGLTARLARSLNLPTDAGPPAPSAFVAALETAHARLIQSRADLGAWADDLEEREMALERDRKAVEALRVEAAASLRLAALVPPRGRSVEKRGVLARLMWWRRG